MVRSLIEDLWYGFHLLFFSVVVLGTAVLVTSLPASNETLVIIPFIYTVSVVVLRRLLVWVPTDRVAKSLAKRNKIRKVIPTTEGELPMFVALLFVFAGYIF